MSYDYEDDYSGERNASQEGYESSRATYNTLKRANVDKKIDDYLSNRAGSPTPTGENSISGHPVSAHPSSTEKIRPGQNQLQGNNISQNQGNPTLSGIEGKPLSSPPNSSTGPSILSQTGQNISNSANTSAIAGQTASASTGAAASSATGSSVAAAGTGAAAAGAGAATGGIGTVVVLAASAAVGQFTKNIQNAKNAMRDIENVVDNNKSSGSSSKGWIVVFIFFFLVVGCLSFTPATAMSIAIKAAYNEFANSELGQYIDNCLEKVAFFKDLIYDTDMDIDIDTSVYSQSGIDSQNIIVYEAIIDKAIEKSYNQYMKNAILEPQNLIKALLEIFGLSRYDSSVAYKAYLDKPYPYTLAHSDGSYYTIGDYLDGEIPEDELNNDLNYAEIISVISQREDFNYESITFESFYEILISDNTSTLLYEMEFDTKPTWFYFDIDENPVIVESEEAAKTGADNVKKQKLARIADALLNKSITSAIATAAREAIAKETGYGYFYDATVMPYGLRELYAIAELELYGDNSTYRISNRTLLDENEIWLRGYLGNMVDLGISCEDERTPLSVSYYYYTDLDIEPTGRSLDYYLENSITNRTIFDIFNIWEDNETIEIDYIPTGDSVILDMTQYINQGDYPKDLRGDGPDTIKQSGCCDCSYAMCAAYYHNKTVDIKKISEKYVEGDLFQTSTFLTDYGMTRDSESGFNTSNIVAHITSGNPVIIKIEGKWIGTDNRILHSSSNQHFLVIVGYDANGFYLYDPGSRANTTTGVVLYSDFKKVTIKQSHFITSTDNSFSPRYTVNTLDE